VNEANLNQEIPLAGQTLKEARIAKGLTLEMVHEATKIPMDALKAIEEGYTIRNLSGFYIRGFLKIYAAYLGVDKSKVIPDLPRPSTVRPVASIIDDKASFDFQEWFSKFWTPQRRKQVFMGLGVLIALLIVVKTFAFIGSQWSSWRESRVKVAAEKKAKAQEKKVAKEKAKKEAAKELDLLEETKAKAKEKAKDAETKINPPKEAKTLVPAVETPSAQEASAMPSQEKSVILTVRAKKSGWLRVKADGETIFQSTIKSGDVETWAAAESLEISGKNIAQLEFELNGKLIGPLSRQERGAQKIIVNKNGLSVAK
jgi:cytoskeletal protein RodZ